MAREVPSLVGAEIFGIGIMDRASDRSMSLYIRGCNNNVDSECEMNFLSVLDRIIALAEEYDTTYAVFKR